MGNTVFEYALPATLDPADIVDLRGLEAPGPMVRILEDCTRLDAEGHYLAHLPHVPHPLFPHLQSRQLAWQIHEQTDGSAVLLIRRST